MAVIYASFITSIAAIISLLAGFYKFRRKRKIFGREPWSSYFDQNKFNTILLHQHTKLLFTEEAKVGKIKSFDVVVNVAADQSNYLQFQFFADHDPINKEEYSRLSEHFRKLNADFGIGYIYKKIKKKENSYHQIESELSIFADMLIAEKFIPTQNESWHIKYTNPPTT